MIVPAVLPLSRLYLEEKLALLSDIPSITRVQIDTVDGTFATPASWPYTTPHDMPAMLERGDKLPYLDRWVYEIDLMVCDPEASIAEWVALGATRMTLHMESVHALSELIGRVHATYAEKGISFGIAMNVGSKVSNLESQLTPAVTYVQFMGIDHIGLQGQPFDPLVLDEVRAFHERRPEIPIQIDGGISLAHIAESIAAGVTDCIVGSALMESPNPGAALEAFEARLTT